MGGGAASEICGESSPYNWFDVHETKTNDTFSSLNILIVLVITYQDGRTDSYGL